MVERSHTGVSNLPITGSHPAGIARGCNPESGEPPGRPGGHPEPDYNNNNHLVNGVIRYAAGLRVGAPRFPLPAPGGHTGRPAPGVAATVAGVALLMAFGRRGVLGGALESVGLDIAFTPIAVIIAQVFVSAPFYIKSAALGFSAVEPELSQAAGMDGARPWQVLSYVVLPLSWSAMVSGAVMTWARALGEFGATIIFAGNFPGRTQTMPLAIYIGFELDLNIALTLSVILIGLSFLALFTVKVFLGREWIH